MNLHTYEYFIELWNEFKIDEIVSIGNNFARGVHLCKTLIQICFSATITSKQRQYMYYILRILLSKSKMTIKYN